VNSLKGVSSRLLRQQHPDIRKRYWKGVLWSPSSLLVAGERPLASCAEVKTAWHSATEVDDGTAATASTLYFSALTTTGLRVDLLATNILNAHQKVQDATGATPVGFEPGYIDPLGRVVMLAIRKAF
jgi:hypothetical protein